MKRYSTKEKNQILNDLAASDQSRAAFCRERGLGYKRVCSWVHAQPNAGSAPSAFALVDLHEEPVDSTVEVWVGSSLCVRFAQGTAPTTIASFCREVSGC
ncbi:MAG: hypothetical protein ACI9JZ_003029 [Lentimonas sp.]|jgi:hypothetical protein